VTKGISGVLKNPKNLSILLVLVSIILLGAILRIKDLSTNPPGFYADEASIGYNAYKILTTGHDEHGKFMPVFFEAFGEYKNPFAIYPVVPLIAFFGPNEFAVRLTQAIWGLFDILIIFFLGRELFGAKFGILAAFILAISPWHVHMSRFIIESHNAFIFFVCGGLLFTLISIRKKWETRYLIFASIFWALSFYTYFATRIFTPLFLIGLALIFIKEILLFFAKHRKKFLLTVLLFGIIIFPFVIHLLSGKALLRFQQVSLNREDQKIDLIGKSKNLYVAHLAPKFVFITGDSDYPGQMSVRHSVTGMGLMYKWQLPFFLIGLVYLMFFKNRIWGFRARSILLLMLFLYPLGSVISEAKTPYATRSVIGVVPYTLIIACGIWAIYLLLQKIRPLLAGFLAKIVFSFTIIFLTTFYLHRFIALSGTYINVASGYNGFQYGTRDVMNFFLKNYDFYDLMILYSGVDGGDAYVKFYTLDKCSKCYYRDPKMGDRSLKKLIAVSSENTDRFDEEYSGEVVENIFFPNGREAYKIYSARSK